MSDDQSYIDRLALLATNKDAGCGDNSCMFGRMGGMATNGGCRCLEELPRHKHTLRRALQAAVALAHHVNKHGFTRKEMQEGLHSGVPSVELTQEQIAEALKKSEIAVAPARRPRHRGKR